MSARSDLLPEAVLDQLVPVVRASAAWIRAQAVMGAWGDTDELEVRSKSDPTDFVTRVDFEVEARLTGFLTRHFPGIGLLAEEGTQLDAGTGRFWVLDPLDGTRNFIRNYPGYGISLALVQDGAPVLGIVMDVVRDQLYSAIRNRGAYLGRNRLRVNDEQQPGKCVVGVGFPVTGRSDQLNLGRYLRLLSGTAALRQGGSVALELAMLAKGSLDAFWQPLLSPWDIAAGMLLVEEAGGRVEPVSDTDWLGAGTLGLFAASDAAFAGIRELIE